MNLDVTISSNWQALFANKESSTISTNQQTILHYYPTDPATITKLQDRYSNVHIIYHISYIHTYMFVCFYTSKASQGVFMSIHTKIWVTL